MESCVWSLAGRCVHHFSVMVINSTRVSLSWTLIDKSSPPIFMVVQWSLLRKQDSGRSADMWARLPYTDGPTYLRGKVWSVVGLDGV